MEIINLTRSGEQPQAGDKIRKVFANGSYEESFYVDLSKKVISNVELNGREWRDAKLEQTDWIVSVTDHPQHVAYLTYRQELRDWPATEDFPNTKPTLGI
jgi:hypothetical protein